MTYFEFSSLTPESHYFQHNFPHVHWASKVNERQVKCLSSVPATPNAAERVLSFLQSDPRHNLLWLSDSFCISLNCELDEVFDDENSTVIPDEGVESVEWFVSFKATPNESGRFFYGLPSAEDSSILPVDDALFQILAWHKELSEVRLSCSHNRSFASWPVSVHALETFVGQAKSPRSLDFAYYIYVPLSAEKSRVLAFGCNDNIKLMVRRSPSTELVPFLTEALKLNQSPKRLYLLELESLPDDVFNAFIAAVEGNTSLLELQVSSLLELSGPKRVALFRTIGRTKGLRRLDLRCAHFSDTEWKVLWEESLSRHPTIRTIRLRDTSLPREPDMQRRHEVMVRSIRTNSVLTSIEYSEDEHSPNATREEDLLILQFNRFRPLVQAIKQEEDQALRCRLFTMTLLHDQVRNRPAFRYLLLNENPDLLCQCIRKRQELLCRRYYQLMEQLDAVVGDMDDCGMSLPSLMANSGRIIRKRKR